MGYIIIDEGFRALLPELDAETFAGLEENIIKNGVRDPIVLWGDTLIDGYNRYAICQRHDLPFNTVNMEFSSREEVLIWIVNNQITRRNLTPIQLAHFRGLHYRADKIIRGTYDRESKKEHKYQNDTYEESTAKKLAGKYNVSPITIKRNSRMSAAIDAIGEFIPEAKRKILNGAVRIDKNALESLSTAPPEEIAKVAVQIEDGSYEKQKTDVTIVMNPFEEAILKISGELFTELKKQAKEGGSKELKTALRSYIVMLEDLYKKL